MASKNQKAAQARAAAQAQAKALARAKERRTTVLVIAMSVLVLAVVGALVFFVAAAPTGAFAEFKPTAAQRSACMGDAMSLCSSVLMSMDRVLSCLSSKKSQLSTGCRLQFEKGSVAQK